MHIENYGILSVHSSMIFNIATNIHVTCISRSILKLLYKTLPDLIPYPNQNDLFHVLTTLVGYFFRKNNFGLLLIVLSLDTYCLRGVRAFKIHCKLPTLSILYMYTMYMKPKTIVNKQDNLNRCFSAIYGTINHVDE